MKETESILIEWETSDKFTKQFQSHKLTQEIWWEIVNLLLHEQYHKVKCLANIFNTTICKCVVGHTKNGVWYLMCMCVSVSVSVPLTNDRMNKRDRQIVYILKIVVVDTWTWIGMLLPLPLHFALFFFSLSHPLSAWR